MRIGQSSEFDENTSRFAIHAAIIGHNATFFDCSGDEYFGFFRVRDGAICQ
jgi:hypothetical protein